MLAQLAPNVLYVLLTFVPADHRVEQTITLDLDSCYQRQEQKVKEGLTAVCVPKSCVNSVAGGLPGWTVQCFVAFSRREVM